MKRNIRIAIQKDGRMRAPSLKFLASLGIEISGEGGVLREMCKKTGVEVLFVRNSDIPVYVQQNVADFGITGKNVILEKNSKVRVLKTLGFGQCQLVIAGPKEVVDADISEARIATSYPNSLKAYLKRTGKSAAIIEINGAVEIAPALNMSDFICDICQSGRTLKENGLKVMEVIFDSEAVLIGKNSLTLEKCESILGKI